jgi:hypothetical protein
MTLKQRQEKLIKQISTLNDDELSMLEQELSFLSHTDGKDIVDGLNAHQVQELISLMNEPDDDVISEADYKNATERWRSK